MRIVTWNVNGLRRNTEQVGSLFQHADVVCLQETRCHNALDVLNAVTNDFAHFVNVGDIKGYSGVSVSVRKHAYNVKKSFVPSFHDVVATEGRAIACVLDNGMTVCSLYSPNSGTKRLEFRVQEFEPALRTWVANTKNIVLVGDLNVAPENIDIHDPKGRHKLAGFTPQEREQFRRLVTECALVDSFRTLHPHEAKFSYWSNFAKSRERNKGWRIDHVLVSRDIEVASCDIMTDFMGSDHAPVWAHVRDIPLDRIRIRLRAHQLKELDLMKEKPTALFGARSYERVIEAMGDNEYRSLSEVLAVSGVGEKIGTVIDLAVRNKKDPEVSKEYDRMARDIDVAIKIPGVGPKKAMELVRSKDWQKTLSDAQRLALENLGTRIPREEMIEHERYVCGKDKTAVFAGSYRRGATTSGDIDVLTTNSNLVELLGDYIVGTLAHGPHKFMGLCRLREDLPVRRIDIVFTKRETWGLALVYFTGSKEFNVRMRAHAHRMGYVLSEHSLAGSKTVSFPTEESVFKAIGMEFVPPEERR